MGLFDFVKPKVGPDEFAARAMARLTAMGWPHPITYDRESFSLELGGEGGTLNLGRIFQAWSTYPKREQAAALDEAIAFVFDTEPKSLEEAGPMLVPTLRSRAVWEAMLLEPGDSASDMTGALKPFSAELVLLLAIDRPRSFAMVNGTTLKAWGCTFEEVFEIALNNLRQSPPLHVEWSRQGFYVTSRLDLNVIAQLLLPERLNAPKIKGRPVVVAAAPDCLLMAGSEDPRGLEAMAAFAPILLHDHPRPVSYTPLILEEGGWSTYEPGRRLPVVRDLFQRQKAQEYDDLSGLMQGRMERLGRPHQVGPFIVISRGGAAAGVALWLEPQSLLPKADHILIQAPGGPTFIRRWEDVEAACGSLPREPDTAVPYHVTSGWPDEQTMKTIEAAPEPGWAKGLGVRVANGAISFFG